MSRLTIYVSSEDCMACKRARELGSSLDGAFPYVEVEIVSIDELPSCDLPEAVVAVPTYLLDGVVISLGNPREASLREKLAASAVTGG